MTINISVPKKTTLLKGLTVLGSLFGALSALKVIPGVSPAASTEVIGFSAAAFKVIDMIENALSTNENKAPNLPPAAP